MELLHSCWSYTILIFLCFCDHAKSYKVLELSDKFLDIRSNGIWLVKFYAPWCGHCKQLEPIWNQVAQSLHGTQIRVARIDCTRFTSVPSALGVKGFPTILFMHGSKIITYRGERQREDIVDFAIRVAGPPVRKLTSCDHLKYSRMNYNVFFVHEGPQEDDNEIWSSYVQVAEYFHANCFMFAVPENCLLSNHSAPGNIAAEPSIHVVKDGELEKFTVSDYEENINVTDILYDWVNKERFSLYPRISTSLLGEMFTLNKLLVITVLEESKNGKLRDDMQKFKDLMHDVASLKRLDYRNHFQFGWVPKTDFINSIAIDTLPVPSVIVINTSNYEYYVPDDQDQKYLTLEAIDLFLSRIISGDITALGGNNLAARLLRAYYDAKMTVAEMWQGNPMLTAVCFGLPFGFLCLICYSICFSDILDAKEEEEENAEESTEDENHEKRE